MGNLNTDDGFLASLRSRLFRPILAGASLRERVIACFGVLLGVSLTGVISALLVGSNYLLPLVVAPIGASAVLLFVVPASPLAQPWAVIGGNTISAFIGLIVLHTVNVPDIAAGMAVALAILAMSFTRSLHPPGGAAALTVILAGPAIDAWGWWFPIVPVALNSIILVGVGLIFHRLTGGTYPHVPTKPFVSHQKTSDLPAVMRVGFRESDIDAALARFEQSFDIARDDLSRIFRQVELEGSTRADGKYQCQDIMSKDVIKISRDTAPEVARGLLITHNIRTLPVTDVDGVLLGIVTLRDLLDDRDEIQMVRAAAVASEGDNIMSLLPALTDSKNHAVIITDQSQRVVGLISQTDLLSAVSRLVPRDETSTR